MQRPLLIAVASILLAVSMGQRPGRAARSDAAAFEPTQNEVVVEAGDTLWDLTQRIVGDPFLWPKVWSYNPEITNPHWIYPGNVVRFYPPDMDLASSQEMVAGAVVDIGTFEPDPEAASTTIEVVRTGQRSRTMRRRRHRVQMFVTAGELQQSGVLSNASPDKILLTQGDRVYIDLADAPPAKAGDRLIIYRKLREVRHPKTRALYGYLTMITAIARSEGSTDKDVLQARIEKVFMEVERGQFVAPLAGSLDTELREVPSTTDIEGTVLAVGDLPRLAGIEQVVFVDKGTRDGIARGNVLGVWNRGDDFTKRYDDLPYHEVGRLHVIEAKESASTCVIISALAEIEPGAVVRSRKP